MRRTRPTSSLGQDNISLRDRLEDAYNLPDPVVIAAEIAEDLEAALAEFAEIATSLDRNISEDS